MQDTVRLNYFTSNGEFNVEFRYFKPDSAERAIVKASTPIEVRYVVINNVLYFMLKTDETNAVDMPFSPALYPQGKFTIDEIPDSAGIALTISMFDTAKNCSIGHRLIGLDHDFSVKLRDALLDGTYAGASTYDNSINAAYIHYTTQDMWNMAEASCKIGGNS